MKHQILRSPEQDRLAPLRQVVAPAGTEPAIVPFGHRALLRRQVGKPTGAATTLISLQGCD